MKTSSSKLIGVTGATGFIGGAICYELKKHGYDVVGLDVVRRKHVLKYIDVFFEQDFTNIPYFKSPEWRECSVIIHCAGTSLVGPSIKAPGAYYLNNVGKTIPLLQWCAENKKHFMFSSSASVYKTRAASIREDDPIEPISPYAKSKWMVEQMVRDFQIANGLKSTIFRYFNACGAVSGGIHGQCPGATHIFPRLFECKETFKLNGTDFDTRDGTCIRDYIHVQDIALAHIKCIEQCATGVYNLGTSVGLSNLEIINKIGMPYVDVGRRVGDTDSLIADSSKAKHMLGWTPLNTLDDIVQDLIEWYGSLTYSGLKRHPAI